MNLYSRRERTENRRNIRSAFIFSILTIIFIIGFIFFGLPAIAKFASFLIDLKKSEQPVEGSDTTPPPPPIINSLPNAVNTDKIEIKGTTESGATVYLFLNDIKQELLANKDGNFSYDFNLQKGENTVSAQAKDESGNEGQKTQIYSIVYDDIAPKLDISKPADGSEFFGSRQRQLVIEGTTEENAAISINSRIVVVDNQGNFSFVTTLQDGNNQFTIRAQDPAGNITEKNLSVKYSP